MRKFIVSAFATQFFAARRAARVRSLVHTKVTVRHSPLTAITPSVRRSQCPMIVEQLPRSPKRGGGVG